VRELSAVRIPVVKMGGGYLKAILLNGQETVFGRDEKELAGRLKLRTDGYRVHPQRIELAMDTRGRNGRT
jgi:hypothetical protein